MRKKVVFIFTHSVILSSLKFHHFLCHNFFLFRHLPKHCPLRVTCGNGFLVFLCLRMSSFLKNISWLPEFVVGRLHLALLGGGAGLCHHQTPLGKCEHCFSWAGHGRTASSLGPTDTGE